MHSVPLFFKLFDFKTANFMTPDLSLIIPAYNEEQRIKSSLDYALEFFATKSLSYEIIVVDDGSSDSTVEIANSFASDIIKVIRQPHNMGKGAAVTRGMLEAKGEIRVFSDADFSTPVKEIDKVITAMSIGTEVFIGSRALDYSMIKKHQPAYREFMGKTFNKLVQLFLISGIKDTQCGFKGFTAKAAQDIFSKMKIKGFGFDLEIIYLADKLGFAISEVPVEWYNDDRSTVNPIKDSITMFFDIFKVKNLHKKDTL